LRWTSMVSVLVMGLWGCTSRSSNVAESRKY
jgi:hypothetical protein